MVRPRKYNSEEERRAAAAERSRRHRANQSSQERAARLQRDVDAKRARAENETEEQRALRRQRNTESQRRLREKRREQETGEQHALRLQQIKELQSAHREKETEEQRTPKLQRMNESQRVRRKNETEEQRTVTLQQMNEALRSRRATTMQQNEIEEAVTEQYCGPMNAKNCAYVSKNFASEKPRGGFFTQSFHKAMPSRRRCTNLSTVSRKARRARIRRLMETPSEREERLRSQRQRTTILRALETPQEHERRLSRARYYSKTGRRTTLRTAHTSMLPSFHFLDGNMENLLTICESNAEELFANKSPIIKDRSQDIIKAGTTITKVNQADDTIVKSEITTLDEIIKLDEISIKEEDKTCDEMLQVEGGESLQNIREFTFISGQPENLREYVFLPE